MNFLGTAATLIAFGSATALSNNTSEVIAPKAFVLSTFEAEALPWHKYQNLTSNVTIPGLSPIYPNISCTKGYDLCQLTVGESEANAAASVTALLISPKFNLTETYFLIAGIGGIDPHYGGLGSAAFARYAVGVTNQYEVDAREKPKNWSSGYWAYGTNKPDEPPTAFYGAEVFELNENLRDYAYGLALNASLASTTASNKTGKLYNISAARSGPKALRCDVSTSDIYPTGDLLAETAANTTKTFTNGTGKYCLTAQEDTAILEAAVRGAKAGLTDYSRWVLLRTGADFDRPPASFANNTVGFFQHNNTGGFGIASENLYRAGYPFVKNIISSWKSTFLDGTNIVNGTSVINGTHAVNATAVSTPKNATVGPRPLSNSTLSNSTLSNSTLSNSTLGNSTASNTTAALKNATYAPSNYIGDVFGSLGGVPDFGPGSYKEISYISTF